MDREEIIDNNPIIDFIQDMGYTIKRVGGKLCTNASPIAEHKDTHYCVEIDPVKQLWHDHDEKEGGTIIDWIMKAQHMTATQAMEHLGGGLHAVPPPQAQGETPSRPTADPTEQYNYTDENGSLLYQVLRYEPKTFKQRQPKGEDWQWDLQGTTRVLYNLPEVLTAKTVCITEGEKDANNLSTLGYVATTNAGGAGTWLPAYADTLKGKDVIVFEDSDAAGKKKADMIVESLQDVAASVKRIHFPGYKDVSDWLTQFPDAENKISMIEQVTAKTPHVVDPIPVYSVWEMEDRYAEFVQNIKKASFGLGNFSKTLGGIVEQIYPGEVVMIVGDTSQGKTAVMQAIAKSAAPLPVLFCELELPLEVMFQRGLQMERGCYERDCIKGYVDEPKGRYADTFKGMHHIWTCPESGIGMDKIASYIMKSELKIGERPKVVMVDYMGLVRASKEFWVKGRYETMAYNAQQAKVVAKQTNTIMFMGSQVSRPAGSKEPVQEIYMHHGKGAGELEESANIVLGVTKPDDGTLILKVVKFTRGKIGDKVIFDFDGPKLQLSERAAA